jgi:hypothetical protein
LVLDPRAAIHRKDLSHRSHFTHKSKSITNSASFWITPNWLYFKIAETSIVSCSSAARRRSIVSALALRLKEPAE